MSHGHPNDVAVPVPYTTRLSQPLIAGQTLNVHGKVNTDGKRIDINLLRNGSDLGAGADAILHLSIRFDEKKIVLNSMTGGTWGKEERESNPWKAGADFDIRIRILEEVMEVSADGKKIHEFKHRLPFQEAQFLQINGDCTLTGVHWGGRFYQLPWETGFENGSLHAGQRIFIYGIPKGDRWHLDMLARNGDILFHFNPRMKESKIIRNAYKNGVWGNEEREGPFPFKKNIGFFLTIQNEPYSIQMFVDGDRVGTYQHRTENPATDYVGLRIDGDVEITSIEYSHH